ncbi:MAG: PilZ domain-containing protein [Actinomycetota bacterium]
MIKCYDRRRHVRYPAQTLMVEVDGEVMPLVDLSIGGLAFEGDGFRPGRRVSLRLSSCLDVDFAAQGTAEVASIHGPRVGASFVKPSFGLLKYVVGHIGTLTGTVPYVFRPGP